MKQTKLLRLHSFSNPISVDVDVIKAFIWSIELSRIELVVEDRKRPIPIDEELYQLQEQYEDLDD